MAESGKLTARKALKDFIRGSLEKDGALSPVEVARIERRLLRDTRRLKQLVDQHEALKAARRAARSAKPQIVFDPFAFGAVVTLQKFGRQALLDQLSRIETANELRLIAEVQHLCVASGLEKLDDIRLAIVRGAEDRIAERYAAAN